MRLLSQTQSSTLHVSEIHQRHIGFLILGCAGLSCISEFFSTLSKYGLLCLWFWWLKLVSGSRYSKYGQSVELESYSQEDVKQDISKTFQVCLITINPVFWLVLLFIVDLHCSWPLHWYLFVHFNAYVLDFLNAFESFPFRFSAQASPPFAH